MKIINISAKAEIEIINIPDSVAALPKAGETSLL